MNTYAQLIGTPSDPGAVIRALDSNWSKRFEPQYARLVHRDLSLLVKARAAGEFLRSDFPGRAWSRDLAELIVEES